MRTSTKKQPFLMRAATTLLLAMLMLASAPWTAWAQVNIPGLTYNSAGGYYEIGSSDDLWSLRNYANSSNGGGAVFKMIRDIDMAGQNFDVIASTNSQNMFCDVFDGDNHTISNLTITSEQKHILVCSPSWPRLLR